MNSKKIGLVLVSSMVFLGGCAMKAQPYQIQYQNQQSLNSIKFEPYSISAKGFDTPSDFSAMCRLTAPLALPDGATFGGYMKSAFIKELQTAKAYAESAGKVTINADIMKLSFSSSDNLTDGNWSFDILFTSSNGSSYRVQDTYRFSSGFDGLTACNNTANAYGPAVGQLLGKAFSSLEFARLLKVE